MVQFSHELSSLKDLQVVILHNSSGLSLFSYLQDTFDENLLSGLITAIKEFTKELALGGLSSFTTDERSIYLIGRNYCTVALITTESDFQKIYAIGYKLGEQFEEKFDLSQLKFVDSSKFEPFRDDLFKILAEKDTPFLISVAEFVKKEFGGEISIQPSFKNNDGKTITVDLLSDRGKKKHQGIFGSMATHMMKSYSEEVTFVKVIDDTAGRGEVIDFVDILKTFGRLRTKNIDENVFPYFPSKAIVVARDFSPTVIDEIKKLPKFGGKTGIAGTHISPDAGMPGAPASMKCFVELWQWHDDKYPTLILN